MTLEALYTLLDGTKIPVSYSSVPLDEATEKPYICYSQDSVSSFAADGKAYYTVRKVSVRLYTDNRSETTEGTVETALGDMYWSKTIEFLDDQKIYEITYEIEV